MKTSETPSTGNAVGQADNRPPSQVMASTMVAIEQLAALKRKMREREGQPQTFEDVVRELMRPVLENWLERAVPKLVENVLRPELRRAFDGH